MFSITASVVINELVDNDIVGILGDVAEGDHAIKGYPLKDVIAWDKECGSGITTQVANFGPIIRQRDGEFITIGDIENH